MRLSKAYAITTKHSHLRPRLVYIQKARASTLSVKQKVESTYTLIPFHPTLIPKIAVLQSIYKEDNPSNMEAH